MIGLEYILEVFKVQQKDLADELGIKKQNITLWLKEKQNISKKYLPRLSEKFGLPKEYFQKELTELEKIYIDEKQVNDYIDKSSFEYEDDVWDEKSQKYVKTKYVDYDRGAMEHARNLEMKKKEIFVLNKIKATIHNISENDSFDTYIDRYSDNIELFERYVDIIDSKVINKGMMFEVLRALELCVPKLEEEKRIWGEGKKGTGYVEGTREMSQELLQVFKKHIEKDKLKQEKNHRDTEEIIKLLSEDSQ